MSGTRMKALPAKHFAFGPYTAEQIDQTRWVVVNRNGLNCLTFPDKPGAVMTDEHDAKQIVDDWNNTDVFVYPPDSYVPPVTTRMTNEEMTAYIHSRRHDFTTRSRK